MKREKRQQARREGQGQVFREIDVSAPRTIDSPVTKFKWATFNVFFVNWASNRPQCTKAHLMSFCELGLKSTLKVPKVQAQPREMRLYMLHRVMIFLRVLIDNPRDLMEIIKSYN